ncbi:MAG: hypothetical protein HZA79_13410 [Sphingobacteriales bacterium]|nr:hypothetical protein [Sphingobacteriales bacterium]
MALKKIILLVFMVVLIVPYVTAQKPANSYKYRLLTYGLRDDTRRNASSIIQQKWKIEIYSVAGCIVTQQLEDSVKRENDKTYKLIENEYGKGWENKFDAEVENEYKIEAQIDSLVKKQAYIENKEIVNPLPGAPFPMYPVGNNGNYIVAISTYNRQWEEQKLYRLKVNYIKGAIEVLEDYIQSN